MNNLLINNAALSILAGIVIGHLAGLGVFRAFYMSKLRQKRLENPFGGWGRR